LGSFHLSHQNGVARLALSSPPRNTLTRPLMLEMAKTVRRLTHLPLAERPRVLVLASDLPNQFCFGIDPQAVLDTDVAGCKAIFYALAELVEALWFGYVPVVADVSGPAMAGGAVLAAVADFALIDAHAGKISFSEVKVGLPLPLFVQKLVERRITPSAWNEVMLLGRNVDAAEAVRIGFANGVYHGETEREEALSSLLGRITRLPPEVLSETLRQSRASLLALLPAFRQDDGLFADFLTDDYLGKGMRAVVAGETPKF
jgi:enoyl-CoA hydratase/carnithine racemase